MFKGQWVWLPVRSKGLLHYPESLKELGVIRSLVGDTADGYYCSDGERFKVHVDMVHALKQERQSWLNLHKDFKLFQHKAVVGGHQVRAFSLGNRQGLLCFGLAKLTGILTHGTVEEGHIVAGATQGALLLTAPNTEGGEADEPSKAMAEKAALEQPADPGVVTIDGRQYVETPGDPNQEPTQKEKTNSTALVACVVGIGALVLWSTY
jgi:hypothetical protein